MVNEVNTILFCCIANGGSPRRPHRSPNPMSLFTPRRKEQIKWHNDFVASRRREMYTCTVAPLLLLLAVAGDGGDVVFASAAYFSFLWPILYNSFFSLRALIAYVKVAAQFESPMRDVLC